MKVILQKLHMRYTLEVSHTNRLKDYCSCSVVFYQMNIFIVTKYIYKYIERV